MKDRTSLNQFDLLYKRNIDQRMCTEICPCEIMNADDTKVYPYNLEDSVLRTYGRTTGYKNNAERDQNARMKNPEVVQLYQNSEGKATYKTFKECYLAVLDTDDYKGKN